jgi:transposase
MQSAIVKDPATMQRNPSRRHSRFKSVPFIGITGITGISASREFFTGAFRHLKQLLPRFKNVSHKLFPVNFSA